MPTLRELAQLARARGESRFDAPGPCARGHTALRFASNGICTECQRQHGANNYSANKAKIKRQVRAYELANADRVRGWTKAKYARNRTRLRAVEKERRLIDPAYRAKKDAATRTWRLRNREKCRATKRRFNARHPERLRAEEMTRRARKLGAAAGDRKSYARFVKWSRSTAAVPCYWCGKRTTKRRRHLDHVIPLAKGGSDSVGNLCVSCPDCNQRKNAKLPEDFAGQSELHLF